MQTAPDTAASLPQQLLECLPLAVHARPGPASADGLRGRGDRGRRQRVLAVPGAGLVRWQGAGVLAGAYVDARAVRAREPITIVLKAAVPVVASRAGSMGLYA